MQNHQHPLPKAKDPTAVLEAGDPAQTVPAAPEDPVDATAASLKDNPDEDVPQTFPQRLMDILSDPSAADTISWLPHGKGFIIHEKKRFADQVLPRYFKKSKFTSFTRKLNRWSFVRVTRGHETGAYYHPLFQKANPKLCTQMTCISAKAPQQLQPMDPVALGLGTPERFYPQQQQQYMAWQQQQQAFLQHVMQNPPSGGNNSKDNSKDGGNNNGNNNNNSNSTNNNNNGMPPNMMMMNPEDLDPNDPKAAMNLYAFHQQQYYVFMQQQQQQHMAMQQQAPHVPPYGDVVIKTDDSDGHVDTTPEGLDLPPPPSDKVDDDVVLPKDEPLDHHHDEHHHAEDDHHHPHHPHHHHDEDPHDVVDQQEV